MGFEKEMIVSKVWELWQQGQDEERKSNIQVTYEDDEKLDYGQKSSFSPPQAPASLMRYS